MQTPVEVPTEVQAIVDQLVEASRPPKEEYDAIIAELSTAEQALVRLRLLAKMEQVKVPGINQDNLLKFRFSGVNSQVPSGDKLQRMLVGQQALVDFLTAELEDWNARDEAYVDAFVATQPTPEAEAA